MKTKYSLQTLGLQRGDNRRLNAPWPAVPGVLMLLAALGLTSTQAAGVNHGVSAGTFLITSEYGIDNNNNCTNTLGLSINGFRPGTYNRADLNVQIGETGTDNVADGILLSSVMENGRTNFVFGTNNFYSISTVHDAAPIYRICSFTPYLNANNAYAAGAGMEYNVNVAGAWFPYNRYLGGLARNSGRANGGSNDVFASASPQLVWGTHYRHIAVSNDLAAAGGWLVNAGKSVVDLTTLGINSKTDGILLVNGGKDEQNFALSQANDDGTWTLYVHDNATTSASSYEQDPVAFVYIPRTNTDLVSGKFNADGSIAIYSGSAPEFSVSPTGTGRWHLQMNNYASSNGVLMVSAEGGTTYNLDNIVSYQIEGLGWQIQSRDTPANGLQTPNADEAVASFVFIPAPPLGFTVTPSANLQTSEAGNWSTFTVVLNAKPTADVTLDVTSSDASEGIPDQASLTFTTDNWYVPQTVTVYGQDDAEADGQVPYSILLSAARSADARFNGLKPADVQALNADNEPGVTLSANALTTSEAATTATFTVVLNSPPADTVTLALSSSDTTEGTVTPASLTFTPADYLNPQTVTVTGVDDSVLDGDVAYKILTAPATSADPVYNGFNALDVSVTNLDNDTAGLKFTPAGTLTVSESGSTAAFSVALASQPASDVSVSFTSSDTTEGTVTPASRTFTPANWATPQTFTLTGVDDAVNDGPTSYTLTASLTSTDGAYAGLHPTLKASTLDNEATLVLSAGTLVYGIGWPGLGIDGSATITDPGTSSYAGGSLTLTFGATGQLDDRLEIRHTGSEAGQIGVSGTTVSYGGTPLGTFTGGVGPAPLVITFNAAAGPDAAQALLRNITYRNLSATPSLALRIVTVMLANGQGGTSTAAKPILLSKLHISDFQEGRDGGFGPYTGTKDTEILATAPDTSYTTGSPSNGSGLQLRWGSSSLLGPDEEVLLRFDNIIGTNAGQIPPGAIVVEADLMLNVVDSGDGSPLCRMLMPWDDTVTWNGMIDGVQMDGVEADSSFVLQGSGLVAASGRTPTQFGVADLSGATGLGTVRISVVPDIQYWADGGSNYGWVLPCWKTNADNTIFSPCEATNVAARPRLLVKWLPAGTLSASFRQGVDDYAGTVDTRVRKGTPDTQYSTIVGVFSDYEVTSGMEDPEHVLLRFDDLFGTNTLQVPVAARIRAAILELGDFLGDSTGDGGTLHRMLQPWQATNTWNTLVDGVSADDVEAAAIPTATAGSPTTLEPNVQGGYVTFDVTADVQLWAGGTPNYGWVILPLPYGGDGWGFATSENATLTARPRLRIYYDPTDSPTTIVLHRPVVSAGAVELKFDGATGKTYTILRHGSAEAPLNTWTVLGTAVVPAGGTATFTDSAPLPNAAFYRVRE